MIILRYFIINSNVLFPNIPSGDNFTTYFRFFWLVYFIGNLQYPTVDIIIPAKAHSLAWDGINAEHHYPIILELYKKYQKDK